MSGTMSSLLTRPQLMYDLCFNYYNEKYNDSLDS